MSNPKTPTRKPQDEIREISISDTMRTLYAFRKSIIAVVSVSLAIGIFLSLLPRRYQATGQLWVEPGESSGMALSSLSSLLNGQTNAIVASEVEVMDGRTLLLRVAKELNLVNNREFWGPFAALEMPKPADRTLNNPSTRDLVYKKLSHVIRVDNNPENEIIEVSATTIDPQLSAKIVNTLINDYLEYLIEMRYGATQRASSWLIQQIEDLKKKVDDDQVQLTELQSRLGVIGFTPATSTYIYGQSLATLTEASDQATIERIIAEAKLRYLQESKPDLIEGEINLLPQPQVQSSDQSQSLLASLRVSQAAASSAYARLLSTYGRNFPEVQQEKAQLDQINKQIRTEEQRILNQAQVSYSAAKANEQMTSGKLASAKAKVFDDKNAMVKFARLSSDYAADRSLYEGLMEHLQEAGLSSALDAADVDVVDLADVPGKPTLLGPLLFIPGTIILGLILGGSLALWMGTLDRRIISVDQVERATALPLLAQIPHFRPNRRAGEWRDDAPIVATARRSHYAEAVRSLRASLLLARPGSPPRVIMCTSAMPNEGKSITAVNLAAILAMAGGRTLLVDCDLHRGVLAQRLRLSPAKGVTSVVAGQANADATVMEVPDIPGLYLLPRGPKPPDPAVMIGSREMRELIATYRNNFDCVVLDSPPILGIADGLHLGQLVDAVVMVVRENRSNSKAVAESVRMMVGSNLPVAGFVLNDIDPRAATYSYGYSYRDYYSGYYHHDQESQVTEEVSQ